MNKIIKCSVVLLFTLLTIDLFLFGGGRVVDFGGVTLRMLLFACCVSFSLLLIITYRKISKTMVAFVLLAMFLLISASYISVLRGELNLASLSPYLFVLLAIVFSLYPIKFEALFRKYLPYCSIFMAFIYLAFIAALFTGKASILDVYRFIPKSEVFLRGGEGLVYKGFIFIMLGALYFIICRGNSILKTFFALVCITAILFTLTRGFVISLLLTVLIYMFFNKGTGKFIRFSMLIACVATPVILLLTRPAFLFREGSDDTRINDILTFLDYVNDNPQDIAFGSGISGFLGERPGIENVYMDVVLHFGLLGLVMLLAIYVKIHLDYKYIAKNIAPSYRKRIDWLYYSIFLLYLQSTFNPYINNYIGGVFVVMVLFYFNATRICLAKLKTKAKSESELFELA